MNLPRAMAMFLVYNADDAHNLQPRVMEKPGLDIDPLPTAHHNGLIAVAVMATLSFFATLALSVFITYRLIFWRSKYSSNIGLNQYVILIYNLVIADMQQALAFLLCYQWITEDKIRESTPTCFIQGLFLQIGDPGSGLFVLAIALHTFVVVIMGKMPSHTAFSIAVVGLWTFIILLVIIPLAIYGRYVFIPSGAWCWIDQRYERLRLWTHYLWIFISEFGTICLYAVMWFQLRRRISQSSILGTSHTESLKRLRRVIGYMVLYPVSYIILSLPLAAGRMTAARGRTPSVVYFCVSGAIIASSGFVDVLLYTLTRRNLILDSEPNEGHSYNRFNSSHIYRKDDTHLTTITADPHPIHAMSGIRGRGLRFGEDGDGVERAGSTDNIMPISPVEMAPMGKVYQHTTIEVTREPAYVLEDSDQSSDSMRGTSRAPDPFARKWGR